MHHNGDWYEPLSLLHISCGKMFAFCDVLHVLETQQNSETNCWGCTVWTGNHLTCKGFEFLTSKQKKNAHTHTKNNTKTKKSVEFQGN